MAPSTDHPWYRRGPVLAGMTVAGLALGGVGVAWATAGHPARTPTIVTPHQTPAPALNQSPSRLATAATATPSPSTAPTPAAPATAEVPGVDCENGVIKGTTTACDEGPAAANAADASEAEANQTEAATETGSGTDTGVDCENGIVKGSSTPCDGGPSANPTDNSPDQTAETGS